MIPTTDDINLTQSLPKPSNLQEIFEKFGIVPPTDSTAVILQQKSTIEEKNNTINELTNDLAKVRIKREEMAQVNQQKDDKIRAMSDLIKKLRKLEDTNAQLKADNEYLRQQHNRDVRKRLTKRKMVKLGHNLNKITQKDKEAIVTQYMSPYWSKAQISAILRKDWKNVHKWGPEDFQFALTLRLLSRRAYEELRKKKCLPLPGYSTLKRYFRDFQITEGIFDDVMAVLKNHAEKLSLKEKVVALAFDEVCMFFV